MSARSVQPTIVLSCLNGFSVRYLLRTDVLRRLTEAGARCVILFGGADDPAFAREFAAPNVVVRKLRNEQYQEFEARRPFTRFLKMVKRFTLNGRYDTTTVDTFFRLYAEKATGVRQRAAVTVQRICIALLKRSTWLRRMLVVLEDRWLTPSTHRDVFDEFNPDVLVVTTLGYLDYDGYVMREARRAGARVVSVILSWDNPSSKGMGSTRADHVVTWTENMAREIVELHDYRPAAVTVGGVAHFDDYFRPEMVKPRSEFYDGLGLDPNRRVIFFAAKSPSAYPWNPEIIELLAEAAENGRFSVPCQIVARVHPAQFVKKHAVVGSARTVQEVNWERYTNLKARYRNLHFSVPELRVSSSFDISGNEATALASLLKHSDVVVNCFSTINLEAAIFDKPIVNVAFNGTGRMASSNQRHNLAIDEAQSHNQRVVKSGAVRIARTPDELLQYIDESLLAPEANAELRRRLVETECGGYIGEAGRRIADLILAQVRSAGRTSADSTSMQNHDADLHEAGVRA